MLNFTENVYYNVTQKKLTLLANEKGDYRAFNLVIWWVQ